MPPKKSQPKKKKAAGPQRGFATTSTPKKVVEAEVTAAEEPTVVGVAEGDAAVNGAAAEAINGAEGSNGAGGGVKAGAVVGDGEGWDEVGNEKHQLQVLADKIRPGSDKEIARLTKVSQSFQKCHGGLGIDADCPFARPQVIDYERPLAKTYPTYTCA